MIRLDAVTARLEARVPALAGRLGNAADFAAVVERNAIPQITPAAFVLFAGLWGGTADLMTGLFRQDFKESVSVVLMDRVAGDPLGEKALRDVTPMVRNIIEAICGWGPEDAPGVFQLGQAELVGAKGGALVFQIDFTLNDQMRIDP
ncbi:MAG: hypothetical protein ACK5NN_00215 [Sphingomonadaceae bacterium]